MGPFPLCLAVFLGLAARGVMSSSNNGGCKNFDITEEEYEFLSYLQEILMNKRPTDVTYPGFASFCDRKDNNIEEGLENIKMMMKDLNKQISELRMQNHEQISELRTQNHEQISELRTQNHEQISELRTQNHEQSSELRTQNHEMTNKMNKIHHSLQKWNTFAMKPADCSEVLDSGKTKSGVYEIYPSAKYVCSPPVKVWCDMDTNGGGWTVFLARMSATVQLDFTKKWQDYKHGFGEPEFEHWLGNEYLHEMTTNRKYAVRIDAVNYEGGTTWGEWNHFQVDSEIQKYKLHVGEYNEESLVPDATGLYYSNNCKFSTIDHENDPFPGEHCAEVQKGGWWYSAPCYKINPTGVHGVRDWHGILFHLNWKKTEPVDHYASWLQIKIRPSK